MVYVTPTQDMLVRPGQHVSGDGRLYHHYLAHWAEAADVSVSLLSGLSYGTGFRRLGQADGSLLV